MTTLTRAIYSAHLQLDPHFVKVSADAAPIRDLFTGLMAFNEQGNVIPALAREWFSDDGKNWLFILDENRRWSNGEPVTASDFVASWQRLVNPSNQSPLANYLIYMGIEHAKAILQGEAKIETLGVKALNSHTLQITLHQVNRQLPQMLAHSALLPTYQGKKTEYAQLPVTNGAYKVNLIEKGRLQLQAVTPELPFQQVIYQLITTVQNPNRFDIIENPLPNYTRDVKAFPRLCNYFYEFNFNDPALQKLEARQAIRAMVSPAEISRGFGIPNHLPLPKTLVPQQDRIISTTSSEQLLNSMGISASQPLKLKITHDNDGIHSDIANKMALMLSRSDMFRVELEELNWQQFLTKREQQNFQLIRSGWCSDYDDALSFLNQFYSSSPDNKSGYKNEYVDQLLTQLNIENLTPEQRSQLVISVIHQLEKDVAVLPLFQYQRRVSIDPSLYGYDLNNASEVIYSKDLYRQYNNKDK
ncbi:peptide ABC transporter substrate-binding protein [Glaesserella australis]|nr:peptide ABC transporter substrate-binding protein [Glaesserella australis]